MSGEIAIRERIDEVLKKHYNVVEMYVDEDFNFMNFQLKLYFKQKGATDSEQLFTDLTIGIDKDIRIYITGTYDSIILENKRLMWYEGEWLF